jgi:hypothetical protein
MTETPDYSDIESFPDGRTPMQYDRDYRKILGDAQSGELTHRAVGPEGRVACSIIPQPGRISPVICGHPAA